MASTSRLVYRAFTHFPPYLTIFLKPFHFFLLLVAVINLRILTYYIFRQIREQQGMLFLTSRCPTYRRLQGRWHDLFRMRPRCWRQVSESHNGITKISTGISSTLLLVRFIYFFFVLQSYRCRFRVAYLQQWKIWRWSISCRRSWESTAERFGSDHHDRTW